ncbi:MAG: hypothetical protein J6571_05075 [Snodgrassella sp.]|uniref:CHY-type domain-containing protein n=1 Tax=Snodgrassella alvi TaxID=1196083 RepID=A0A2N9XI79_9NEIS|nr:CHY zinc finger protein [Snodgrassella communis]MCO6506694.1 hypothetical protein [Snodgrassella sp.]MCO6512909.1 hypothetical protein [Snodgrassella sp.]MCO6519707.1 hypothetical protein [Snodgrassella sp.]MCO6522543.1 hypothetical protein [Snodgrassella sp.]MCO6525584.1 hypothetical protein [Snodgrassella sp.]
MILGIETDVCGRCTHYHNENDIAALQCNQCKQYYACFKCHDQMCDHRFVPMNTENSKPVMCGKCKNFLTYEQYQQYKCPFCLASFNPRCALHKNIYFK